MVHFERDGNAQLSAIAEQLEGEETHATVRERVVQTLQNGTRMASCQLMPSKQQQRRVAVAMTLNSI